ncbi:MAG: PhzF family phenazine biosynthesis protein [Lactobacillales bacterium]|jgi:trans-2,3-dihydro-3-hydroxyanthranilate isomerase|nr:PhzF family phenazine biosynthesis protein [Lactobacillales bacterium]
MKFKLVDAFNDKPLMGNPCAIIMDADMLSDKEMLAIAKEMNQSETAFLMKSKINDLKARYFTPEREIPLAGHPTIALIHAAIESGILEKPKIKTTLSLELTEGPIRIDIEPYKKNTWLIHMFQRKPTFLKKHDPNEMAKLFNLKISDFMDNIPIQTVSTGTPMMMLPLKSKKALKKAKINIDSYLKYRSKSDFFSPHFFILQDESKDSTTFARQLGVPPDTTEDIFTGSATGAMAAYLWKYELITQNKFIARQGDWLNRPCHALVQAVGDIKSPLSIIISGTAITVITGEINI